jgi:uncharacterized OsmC-like protein
MNAAELSAVQTPIKEKYKNDPRAAMLTLHAQGKLGEGLTCTVAIEKAQVETGLHPAAGGGDAAFSPGTLLLDALVACVGVTLRAVSTYMGLVIRSGTIQAEGELDLRGTLGVAEEVPIGFQRIQANVELDTDASEEQLKTLFGMTEKYAVVFQTLIHSPQLSVSYRKKK